MNLTDENFVLYAMKHYDNPQCHSVSEFEEDLKRFVYLRKLLSRYYKSGDLKERLILNHITVIYNLFGEASTDMLFFKIEKEYWSALVTFLIYINRIGDRINNINVSDIPIDLEIAAALRKI